MSLEAFALGFGFADRPLGRGVACALRAGEVVCLLGPNGSGKSTLLRTLLGLQPALDGEVLLAGRPLESWPAPERARQLAYVPQAAESYFDFTVSEVVEMGRAAHRGAFESPGARDREASRAAMERLGIASLARHSLHAVSGGERQLALIARSLATEATFLVMDEPTANLDYGNQARVLEEMGRLRAAGIGILFSTHHPEQAFRIADRAILLKEGCIVATGAVPETLTSTSLSQLYGRPIHVATVRGADGNEQRVCLPLAAR